MKAKNFGGKDTTSRTMQSEVPCCERESSTPSRVYCFRTSPHRTKISNFHWRHVRAGSGPCYQIDNAVTDQRQRCRPPTEMGRRWSIGKLISHLCRRQACRLAYGASRVRMWATFCGGYAGEDMLVLDSHFGEFEFGPCQTGETSCLLLKQKQLCCVRLISK
jgi:hypothetical protein